MKNVKGYRHKILNKRVISVIILIAISSSGIGLAFAANTGGITDAVKEFIGYVSKSKSEQEGMQKTEQESAYKAEREARIEEAIAQVALPKNFEAQIAQRGNSEQILRNAKVIIAERKLNDKQREKLEGYVLANLDTVFVYSMYDYLYENFFTEYDIETSISRYNSGESMQSILQTYEDVDDGYVPRGYPDGMIEYLVEKRGVQVEELAVLEILAHRGLVDFDSTIDRLSKRERMKKVFDDLKVLNKNCEITSVSLTTEEISTAARELNISEEEAAKKVVAAKKAHVPSRDVISHLLSGKTNVKFISDYYSDKFERRAER